MTATSPSPAAGRPAVRLEPGVAAAATGGVGGAALVVGARAGLWLGVQLGLAGLLLVVGQAATGGQALNEVAGWWMVYMALVDLGTLGVLFCCWAARAAAISGCWGRRPPPGRSPWARPGAGGQRARGGVQRRAHQRPLRPGRHPAQLRDRGPAPGPAWSCWWCRCWPSWPSRSPTWAWSCPAEQRLGRPWLAAAIVVALWVAEHALYPLLVQGGGLDWGFAAYRVGSVLLYLAAWTATYYALGRRLPIMAAVRSQRRHRGCPGPRPRRMSWGCGDGDCCSDRQPCSIPATDCAGRCGDADNRPAPAPASSPMPGSPPTTPWPTATPTDGARWS